MFCDRYNYMETRLKTCLYSYNNVCTATIFQRLNWIIACVERFKDMFANSKRLLAVATNACRPGFYSQPSICLLFLSFLFCYADSSWGGGLIIFSDGGVGHYKISISTLSGIFDEKVGLFSEFLCLMEVSKVRFWGLFWEKMASIFKKFPKLWIFCPN